VTMYCGTGRELPDGAINLTINLDDIAPSAINKSLKGRRYVCLRLRKNSNGPTQWGKTHHVSVRTFNLHQSVESLQMQEVPASNDIQAV